MLNVKCDKSKIYFNGILNEDIRKIVNDYFDLNRDYTKIKQELSKIDEYMEKLKKMAGSTASKTCRNMKTVKRSPTQ